MVPYARRFIPDADVEIFERIRPVVQDLPDTKLDFVLSCHVLSRAVAKIFALRIVDGKFNVAWDHSWLETKNGNIIDVYPIGVIGGPILVHSASFSPLSRIYEEKSLLVDLRSQSFVRDVEKVVDLIMLTQTPKL